MKLNINITPTNEPSRIWKDFHTGFKFQDRASKSFAHQLLLTTFSSVGEGWYINENGKIQFANKKNSHLFVFCKKNHRRRTSNTRHTATIKRGHGILP